MFCMCINRGCVGTVKNKLCSVCLLTVCVDTLESKLCTVCVLTEVALLQGRVSYVLYVY